MGCFFFPSDELVMTTVTVQSFISVVFIYTSALAFFFEIGVSFNYDKNGVGTVTEFPPGFWRG